MLVRSIVLLMLVTVAAIGSGCRSKPAGTVADSAERGGAGAQQQPLPDSVDAPVVPQPPSGQTLAADASQSVPAEPAAESTAKSTVKPAEPSAEPDSKPEASTSAVPAASSQAKTEPATAAAPTPAETPTTPPAASAPESVERVMLGGAELTAGIPGDGPLTIAELQAWLDNPRNHVVLDVQLPKGLAAGAQSIKIPADNPLTRAKIELGRQLYFERRLSSDGTVSCADCHHPEEGFARHTQFGIGVRDQQGGRNSPASYNRILSGPQFWDGRADSLEAQAVGPIANPIEMANTHEAAVDTLKKIEGYRLQFAKIFGDVNIENVGKAIASFERTIVTGTSPFDDYESVRAMQQAYKSLLDDLPALQEDDPDLYDDYQRVLAASQKNPISESAIRGREIFFSDRGRCSACHVGANLADEKYHNLGVGMAAEQPDLGRFVETKDEQDRGAFKTPTIRNVALTAPYMHDGSQKTLEEVVQWYAKGGHPNPQLSKDIKKLDLTPQDQADLVEFMKACTGPFTPVETQRLPE